MKFDIEMIVSTNGSVTLSIYKVSRGNKDEAVFTDQVDSVETALSHISAAVKQDKK